jgi:hypothetical protein
VPLAGEAAGPARAMDPRRRASLRQSESAGGGPAGGRGSRPRAPRPALPVYLVQVAPPCVARGCCAAAGIVPSPVGSRPALVENGPVVASTAEEAQDDDLRRI